MLTYDVNYENGEGEGSAGKTFRILNLYQPGEHLFLLTRRDCRERKRVPPTDRPTERASDRCSADDAATILQ